ncbi:MAG: molybdenum ABC transporter ATP-binding protein [Proteobacteria bacterium]|nr:molybdenum ABC transporter ATP-binding protein [Pseudomonadota bacterium]
MLDLDIRVRIDALSLHVQGTVPNTVTALFGPSGCGKTTLLRAIAGLTPCSGRIAFNDVVWQDDSQRLPTHKRRIGYVFQQDQLFAHLSVEQNLRYGLDRASVNNISIALPMDDVVKRFDLQPLLNRRAASLSGGASRRANIARAILSQPQLLLLDEPLTGLDAKRKAQIMPYLTEVTSGLGIPTLYVSHLNDEIARLCDHMLVMQQGKLTDQGPTQDVLPRLWRETVETGDPQPFESEAGSLVKATVTGFDEQYSMIELAVAGQQLRVLGQALPQVPRVRVFLAAKDVAIALHSPRDLSIRNALAAKVVQITPMTGLANGLVAVDMYLVTPAANEREASAESPQTISAHISKAASHALGLEVGSAVYALIKSARIAALGDETL